ncbi:MAG: ABC transporter ATP-binding protein [Candidatus Longimicrobiales bacterium M2_2A_002]
MALLEVRDLRTWFDTDEGVARAVDGVSFRVDRGEVVGVVGESGSGKSVTALSIMGLVPDPGRIENGSVTLADRELTGLSAEAMRGVRGAEIAMIFQEPTTSLNPVFPVGEQIAEALRAHGRAGKAAARERAVSLLRRVGIPDPAQRADEYPHQLSGGQRQRVMIAMALANEPSLLIADEPTTALDVTIQAQILELLLELRRELGMAVLLITHDLGVVAETCDRVVVMYGGQVVEEGPVADLFAKPAHPYTRGLLAAVPRPEARDRDLAVIPGTVPSATAWPDGCRFRPRCPYAWSPCADDPGLLRTGDGAAARCWLVEHPDRRAQVPGFGPTGGGPS